MIEYGIDIIVSVLVFMMYFVYESYWRPDYKLGICVTGTPVGVITGFAYEGS